jgi:peptidoglycan-associated lipoprotein
MVALLALSAMTISACRKKAVETAPAPANDSPSSNQPAPPPPDNTGGSSRDEATAREARMAEIRRVMGMAIHFAYDRSDLSAEARQALDAKLVILQQNRDMRIVIDGHADEMGSDEYNIALGQRRAAAAKLYLSERDIAASRIEITSYGEEQPVCRDAAEPCYARNRRAEFRIAGGLN